ncbi:hypothetical protein [Roseivirga pacifica]|uniref:hypothetical protein n=1 Tax=Roseivirga pacifica TaxID=1267423 RepID=UPI003BAB70CF
MEQEEPSKKQLRFFEKFKKKAQQIVNDNAALRSTLVKAQEKLAASDSDEGLKGKLVEYVKLVLRMLTNTINGNYKGLPWQTLVMWLVCYTLLLHWTHCQILFLLLVW